MGDSEDEYDRKRRDKFRGERAEASYRGNDRAVRPRGDEWQEREPWSRPRPREYRGAVRDRGYSPSIDPAPKRMRHDYYAPDNYYGHYQPYHQPPHREPPATNPSESTQPPMMTFKAFLAAQDDNISDSEAVEKYNDYKLEFQRQQLNEFFVAHKDDEWFRLKYHPEDSVKRKDEQMNALKRRVEVFLELLNGGKLGEISVDCSKTDELVKLLDTVVIKLEGGSDADLAVLDQEAVVEEKKPTEPKITTEAPADDKKSEDGEIQESKPTETKEEKSDGSEDKKKNGDVNKKPEEITIDQNDGTRDEEDDEDDDDDDDDEEEGEETEKKSAKDDEEEESLMETDEPEAEQKKSEDNSKEDGEEDEAKMENDGKEADEKDESEENKSQSDVKKEKKRKRSYSGSSSSSSSSDSEPETAEKPDEEAESKETVKTNEAAADDDEDDEEKEPTIVETVEDDSTSTTIAAAAAKERPRALHKTTSIFLRNLAPTITRQEVEAICARYSGFLRVALAEPQAERRWLRRGWVTFTRDANIKEICWNLNNIRLRDCELGAIVNRDLSRRIRQVNGITAHKQVVRSDIRISAKVALHMDTKAGLWADEDGKEKPHQTFGLVSNNPVLHNITDYLIEEASAEEEELLGLESSSDAQDTNAATVERDDSLITVLDRIILYLRIVHSLDYYNHCEYPNEDEMPNRCGILHARGPPPTTKTDISAFIGTPIEAKMAQFLPEKVNREEGKNEAKLISLALKDVDTELDKFVQANTRELAKDKWLCPLSGKKFKGPDFVRKHIFNKHAEKVEEVKKEVEFFNNYLRDPKRPMLEAAPVKREEQPSYSQSHYGASYGGYGGGGGPPRYYNQGGFAPRSRGYPRSRGNSNADFRPVIHYRDLDAPREPEEFI